jgi:hypothetical protein
MTQPCTGQPFPFTVPLQTLSIPLLPSVFPGLGPGIHAAATSGVVEMRLALAQASNSACSIGAMVPVWDKYDN